MYEYFRGTLVPSAPPYVVIDVSGVGYRFRVPGSSLQRLPASGEVTLYASLYVREDELTLFGFLTAAERSVFERLTSVSGVGPSTGLEILSTFAPQELQEAILQEDFARISKVKGIGPKLARRIVLEVKGLVSELYGPRTAEGDTRPRAPVEEEALAALQKLGYPRRAAARALDEASVDRAPTRSEDLVRAALRIL